MRKGLYYRNCIITEIEYIDNIKKTLATAKEFKFKELQFDCEGLYGTPVVR